LDQILATHSALVGLSHLTAVFRQPVLVNQEVSLQVVEQTATDLRLELHVDQQMCAELTLRFGQEDLSVAFTDGPWPQSAPHARDFDALMEAKGALELRHDVALALAQFPTLGAQLDGGAISVLLASTRLVGMEAPGLHSLYSELELQFDGAAGPSGQLGYEVTQSYRDFNLLNMTLTGAGWHGFIRSFLRPAPVSQLTMDQAKTVVGGVSLPTQRALIVGGSRGLGEVCAKLLAAAGAHVTITYAAGQQDSEKICADITAAGGQATAIQLDVLAPGGAAPVGSFTHLYYFAAPRIKPGAAKGLDQDLYRTFTDFFVTGFAQLVGKMQGPLKVIYPSTVYVAAPEKRFAEYAAAKAAGETLCKYAAHARPDIEVDILDLPRMNTDQTQTIISGAAADDPADILWPLIRNG
jgi:NAD(P)-dependent dehydrogenase (short-subunit alcohol dehydrogenase family)